MNASCIDVQQPPLSTKKSACKDSEIPPFANSIAAAYTHASYTTRSAVIVIQASGKNRLKLPPRHKPGIAKLVCARCENDFSPVHLGNVLVGSLPTGCIKHSSYGCAVLGNHIMSGPCRTMSIKGSHTYFPLPERAT